MNGRLAQFPQSGYVTPGSSRSNSSSSLYPGPVYGATNFVPSPLVPSPPRSKTSDDLPTKTVEKNKSSNNNAWHVGVSTSASGSSTYGPEPSPSKSQARAPRFHMHPLLSYTRLHHAPISYDVAFTPSARTVEWHGLGEGSRAQRRVAEAYKERCTRMGGGWEGGIRRVDWLGSKTLLVGVEIDKSNEGGENVGRLVFGRPSTSERS